MRNPFRKIEDAAPADPDTFTKSDPKDESPNERGQWANQVEFALSSMGYAVGLGNLWRFPYLCMRNGGGAFLIPYFTFMVICGMPLFYLELLLGQFSGMSPLVIWKICPLFAGVGWAMLVVTSIVTVYYFLLFAWVFYFLGMSFRSDVPWKSCDNPWNTADCMSVLDINKNYTVSNASSFVSSQEIHTNTTFIRGMRESNRTAAEEFFLFNVLNISSGIDELGDIQWHLLLALLGAYVITFFCMCKGIKSSGKVIYVTVTLPYILLTVLLVRGVTLHGSLQGIKYYILPDWSKLLEFKVWVEACLQVFYTLGPAWGGLITLASYNRFHNNCFRDSIVVCVACSATSFYSGFIIFSVIGFMAHKIGQPIEKVISQGPGLAFVAYPEAISHLPGSPFWACTFFIMLVTLGIDGQFGMLETIISGIIDMFPDVLRKRKTWLVLAVCIVFFLLGLPFVTQGGVYLFQLLDWYVAVISIQCIALCECIVVGYFYGIGQFYNDMALLLRHRPSMLWLVVWCGINPCLLVIMLVVSFMRVTPPTYGDYVYPDWAAPLGWVVAWSSFVPIPLVAIIKVFMAKGSFTQRLSKVVNPQSDWLPSEKKYQAKYKELNANSTWLQRMSLRRMYWNNYSDPVTQDVEKVALNVEGNG